MKKITGDLEIGYLVQHLHPDKDPKAWEQAQEAISWEDSDSDKVQGKPTTSKTQCVNPSSVYFVYLNCGYPTVR